MRLLPAILAVFFCALPAAAAQQPRSELERQHLERTRARYAMPSWARGAVRAGLPIALALPGWEAEPLHARAGMLTRAFRRADEPEAAPAFVIESRVAGDAAAAHDALLDWLAGVSSDQTMPSARAFGCEAGDVAFAGPAAAAATAPAWIAFVRGNVAVRLCRAGAGEADLAALAAAVDRAILATPALERGAAPALPRILALEPGRAAAVAGERIPLRVEVRDPQGGTPHLEWILGGTGSGYVERDADGAWILHTTGPGELTVTLEVTGSLGAFARAAVTLQLADD